MSTFRGKLLDDKLYFMTIDYFERDVYDCDTFLLSHHHCDHMKGIFNDKFAVMVNESPSKFIYCSPVTAHFLRKHYRFSIHSEKMVELQLNKPYPFPRDDCETDVVITSLPAAHCPGSVMFLIEYNSKRILYSGDLRITLNDLQKIQGTLTNPDGTVIKIHDLYLDTTFAGPTTFEDIPPRESSEQAIIHFAKEFLSKSPSHKVALLLSARFGYESLYLNMCKALNKPVMVHKHDYKYYKEIEEMRSCVICESLVAPNDWFIHACLDKQCSLRWGENVKVFKPCALLFIRATPAEACNFERYLNVPYQNDWGVTRVLYSTHCSLNELRNLYRFLKPTNLIPTVKHPDIPNQQIVRLIMNEAPKVEINIGLIATLSTNVLSREEIWVQRAERRKRLRLNDSDDDDDH